MRISRPKRHCRGAMLTLIALLLPIVLIFLGFAVDLAYMQTTRMELRAAADTAARAAATALLQTDDPVFARQTAKTIARRNRVAGERLLLRNSDVAIGRSTLQPNGKWSFSAGATPSNAVRVTAPRTAASRGGAVSLFFGSMIGRTNFEPVQSATASFTAVDICLVLDRSTSMKYDVVGGSRGFGSSDPRFCSPPTASSRWMALDAAVRVFLDELSRTGGEEQVALATYSSDAASFGYVCGTFPKPSSLDSPLSTNLASIASSMDDLTSTVWNGKTYIEAGMLTGVASLTDQRFARQSAEKVLVVLTDGNQNIGSAEAAARTIKAAGVTIHTITFSDDANQSLMRSVARIGNGQHFHANTAEELREVFRKLAAVATVLTQ